MKKLHSYLIVIFLVVIASATFGRIANNDFVNFDDPAYITENSKIKSGINLQTIIWSFRSPVEKNWVPLALISHMLDWTMFGANASGHHIVSLLLHIGAAIFLFLFLNKTTNNIWASAFATAIFAIHPLRVESVAWAAERRDVLSMFFGMAALYAYAFYAESLKLSKYFFCLILFALSLMAKSILVTLPFILLLLDYWPLGRWQKAFKNAGPVIEDEISPPFKSCRHLIGRLLWEKVPFLFLTIASSIITVWAQYEVGSVHPPVSSRVANAISSYVSYLGKILWPVDLAVFYPFKDSFSLWQILTSCFILIAITGIAIYAIKKLPFLFIGWFWYLGTFIPVIGLVPINAPMADRYTYLPFIGIAIMLTWGITSLINCEKTRKKILFLTGTAVLSILAVLTWRQCGYWKNSITLFSHTAQVTKDNYMAYYKLGTIYGNLGQYQRAIENYNEVILRKTDFIFAYNNRGVAYSYLGQYQRAIEDYNKAIKLNPNYTEAYNNRGNAYNKLGQRQRAIENYNEAIRLNPYLAELYNNRANIYNYPGQYQRAIEDYTRALQLKPNYTEAFNNRGIAYLLMGNNELGCPDTQKSCALGNCKALEWAKSKGYCR